MASGGPNFLLQTLGPQQDAAAQAEQAGLEHGTRILEAAKQRAFQAGETAKAQAWQAEQANLNRILQQATTQFGAQQQNAASGVSPGQAPPGFEGANDSMQARYKMEEGQRNILNVSTAQPLSLGTQSDAIQSGAMGALGQAPGMPGGQAGPPDMRPQNAAGYLNAAQTAGQRAQVQRLMPGASIEQQDSLAPYAKTVWSSEAKPARDYMAEADLKGRYAVAARRAGRAIPRASAGKPDDDIDRALKRSDEKVKAHNDLMDDARRQFRDGVSARAKTVTGASPGSPAMRRIEDEVARPLLESLAARLGIDIEIVKDEKTGQIPPGAFADELQRVMAIQADRDAADTASAAEVKRMREPDRFPRAAAPVRSASGPPPTAAEVRAEVQSVVDSMGIKPEDVANLTPTEKTELWNRAKNNLINARSGR